MYRILPKPFSRCIAHEAQVLEGDPTKNSGLAPHFAGFYGILYPFCPDSLIEAVGSDAEQS